MTINELNALRAEKVDAMASIVETRGESMDSDTLDVVKGFKDEIKVIDNKIDAMNELRSVAIANSKPAEVKAEIVANDTAKEFRGLINGSVNQKDYAIRTGTVATNGTNVVPEAFQKTLDEKILEYSNLYALTGKITTADNGALILPNIDDTANVAEWTLEGGTINLSDFSTGRTEMGAYKLTTGVQVTDELIQDSFFNVESYIAKSFAVRFARKIEDAILNGTGTNQMTGLLGHSSTKNVDSAGVGVITIDDLKAMPYELQKTSRTGGRFYVAESVFKSLANEKDNTGRLLLQSLAGATPADGVKHFIDGYEIVIIESLDTMVTGNESAFFGNMSNYLVRNVKGYSMSRDGYTAMNIGCVNFYANMRLDGNITSVNDTFVKITVA